MLPLVLLLFHLVLFVYYHYVSTPFELKQCPNCILAPPSGGAGVPVEGRQAELEDLLQEETGEP